MMNNVLDPKTLRKAADRPPEPAQVAPSFPIGRQFAQPAVFRETVSHNGCTAIPDSWGTRYESFAYHYKSYSYVTNPGSTSPTFKVMGSDAMVLCLGGKGTLIAGHQKFELSLGVEVQLDEFEDFFVVSDSSVTFRLITRADSAIQAGLDNVVPGTPDASYSALPPEQRPGRVSDKVLQNLISEGEAHIRKINVHDHDPLRIG